MNDPYDRRPRGKANVRHLDHLARTFAKIWTQTLRRGFYGKVGFEADIQDGSIQQIITTVNRKQR